MNKRTVRDIDIRNKRVLVRVDFNVPLNVEDNTISDDSRIREALPTVNYLLNEGCRVILCSHFGRPKGKVVEDLRLARVAKRLSELLKIPVTSTQDCIGSEVEKAVSLMNEGEVLMLENLRFHAEEENNDPDFAKALSQLADIYVNDAFGAAHRAHASTEGIAHYTVNLLKDLNNIWPSLSKNARQLVIKKYSWQNKSQKLSKIIST